VVDLIQAQDVDVLDAEGQPAHDVLLDNIEVARSTSENQAGKIPFMKEKTKKVENNQAHS
jgi:hypothetical protein